MAEKTAEKKPEFVYNRALKTIKWFHPNVTSGSAVKILQQRGTVGSFIVHPSASIQGCYTISVKREDDITHVRVQNTGDYYDLYGGEVFATLGELVQFYLEGGTPLRERNGKIVPLYYPLHDMEPTERWYHGKLSGSDASALLTSRGSNGSFLVRESVTKPGEYAISCIAADKIVHVLINYQEKNYIAAKKGFGSLKELIEYHQKQPIEESSGRIVHLDAPLNATRTNASCLDQRVQELDFKSGQKGEGFFREFEELQEHDSQNSTNPEYQRKEGQKEVNRPKNRFKNILPYDRSRVILRGGDPSVECSDYINANRVQIIHENIKDAKVKTYIATQGCLNVTVVDFWRMIYQEKSSIIAMTTKIVEAGKNKCAKYWPDKDKEIVKDTYGGQLKVKCISETVEKSYTLRELSLTQTSSSKSTRSNPRTVYHFHFTAWPDKQVPKDPSGILEFIEAINKQYAKLEEPCPITVHCSAGIGRTGTTIILDHMLDLIKEHGVNCEIDIYKAIKLARTHRSGLVQTDAQYRFIYMAVQYYLQHYLGSTASLAPVQQEQSTLQSEIYENVSSAGRS